MTAYRVTLLDCDVCGEVFDPGVDGVRATISEVRRMAAQKTRVYGEVVDGWRHYRKVDVCHNHAELTMPEALDEVARRFDGSGMSGSDA